ncbi:MAG TPA: oligosaccharide flippase family protein [Bryobacteraceae bacterium]|jgi:O-antigen/teichoic acid export membrane protein|nr:oligosaccharide flippase family protein [Bryobacteraceae bacterium]
MPSKSSSGLGAVMQTMGGRVLFTLINAATGIITARALHPAGRGELAALGVWPNFLGAAMTFGLPSALIFWTRTEPKERSSLLWAALPITLLLGLFSTAVGIVGIPFWLSQYSPYIIHMAQLFMLNAFIVLLLAVARAASEAESDFFASSLALCLTPLVTFFALIAIQVTRGLTPVSAAFGYIIGGIPSCAFLIFRLRHSFVNRPAHLFPSAKKLLNYGTRSYGVDLCGTLSLYADQAIVVHLLNPAAMGVYVVALSLSRTLNVIHQAVASVLFPKAVALPIEKLLSVTGHATRISTLCTTSCGVLVAVFGPVLLGLLYGREYRGATVILNVLIAEVILTGATLVLTRAFMALGRPGLVTILQSSGLVLSLPLLFWFVPKWGVLGASIALLTASVARFFLALASFPLVLKQPAPSLIPRTDEIRALIVRVRGAVAAILHLRSAEVAGV